MAQSGKKKQVTFEEALEKLEAIVEDIEQGKIGLEESVTKYEEGMGLIQHCRKVLADAEMKIQKLQADQQGNLESQPFEPPEPEGADADED